MQRAITWRSRGKRRDGQTCSIVEVTEYEQLDWARLVPRSSYILVDHEPTARVAKGRYRILTGDEVVTCDHPDAP
jgi:hypothetical protein